MGQSGRCYGSGMDALVMGWGRSGRFFGSDMDALVMGWSRSGRDSGWGMDGHGCFGNGEWTLLRFGHGCSGNGMGRKMSVATILRFSQYEGHLR